MNAARIVMRQIQDIMESPMDGIRIRPTDDLHVIEVEMDGPEDTPFAGGVFEMQLVLSEDFPHTAPKGFFKTKVFHPNIADPRGDICVNTLKRDWEPTLGLRHVLSVIRCLLIEPNPESALNEEAGKLLLENYAEFSKRARMMTMVHAMHNNNHNNNNNNKINNNSNENNSNNTMNNNNNNQDAAVGNQENSSSSSNSVNNGSGNSSGNKEDAAQPTQQQQQQSSTSTTNANNHNKAKAANDKRRAMLKRL